MNALKSYGNLPAPFAKEEEFKEESKKVREEREKQDPPLSEVERLRIEQLETRRRNVYSIHLFCHCFSLNAFDNSLNEGRRSRNWQNGNLSCNKKKLK